MRHAHVLKALNFEPNGRGVWLEGVAGGWGGGQGSAGKVFTNMLLHL